MSGNSYQSQCQEFNQDHAEIDHNFSRAHRIVTSQILPVVDEYAKHSEGLWESSKVPLVFLSYCNADIRYQFWKQFFEASANVSLNSYEEPTTTEEIATETDTTTTNTEEPSTSSYLSTPSQVAGDDVPDFTTPVTNRTFSTFHGDNSPDFRTPQTTPRARAQQPRARMASYASPYEKLRREIQGTEREPSTPSTIPSTPPGQTLSDRLDDDGDELAFLRPSTARHVKSDQNGRTPANDPLMHRLLDKNYRIQATPHSQVRLPSRSAVGEVTARTPVTGRKVPGNERLNELDSSPMMEAPQLNAEIFASPIKTKRVPGVSLMTPANKKAAHQRAFHEEDTSRPLDNTKSKGNTTWDSDSDEDGLPGEYSPPKTIQFHIPQSKLLKTPGKYFKISLL